MTDTTPDVTSSGIGRNPAEKDPPSHNDPTLMVPGAPPSAPGHLALFWHAKGAYRHFFDYPFVVTWDRLHKFFTDRFSPGTPAGRAPKMWCPVVYGRDYTYDYTYDSGRWVDGDLVPPPLTTEMLVGDLCVTGNHDWCRVWRVATDPKMWSLVYDRGSQQGDPEDFAAPDLADIEAAMNPLVGGKLVQLTWPDGRSKLLRPDDPALPVLLAEPGVWGEEVEADAWGVAEETTIEPFVKVSGESSIETFTFEGHEYKAGTITWQSAAGSDVISGTANLIGDGGENLGTVEFTGTKPTTPAKGLSAKDVTGVTSISLSSTGTTSSSHSGSHYASGGVALPPGTVVAPITSPYTPAGVVGPGGVIPSGVFTPLVVPSAGSASGIAISPPPPFVGFGEPAGPDVQLNVRIPASIRDQMKVIAAKRKTTMGDAVANALKEEIAFFEATVEYPDTDRAEVTLNVTQAPHSTKELHEAMEHVRAVLDVYGWTVDVVSIEPSMPDMPGVDVAGSSF